MFYHFWIVSEKTEENLSEREKEDNSRLRLEIAMDDDCKRTYCTFTGTFFMQYLRQTAKTCTVQVLQCKKAPNFYCSVHVNFFALQ